jgi:hypothetical protein
MAAGDTHLIANYAKSQANNSPADKWASDVIKVGLITSSTTPALTDSNPCWGAGGAQNYSTNEVTPGGNYTAGGVALSGLAVNQTSAQVFLDATSPISWAANASNPTNARWAVIYDNTTANKEVLGFIDLGAVTSLVSGLQINIAGAASGTQHVFTCTVN